MTVTLSLQAFALLIAGSTVGLLGVLFLVIFGIATSVKGKENKTP